MPWGKLVLPVAAGLTLFGLACSGNPYPQGEILYANFCANCHMDDGSGLEGLIPPLAEADWLAANPDRLPCVIRYGIEDTIQVNGVEYNQPMDGIDVLSDVEITNIINYIHTAWGNRLEPVSLSAVQAGLERCTRPQNPPRPGN